MTHKPDCKWNKEYPKHEKCCCDCQDERTEKFIAMTNALFQSNMLTENKQAREMFIYMLKDYQKETINDIIKKAEGMKRGAWNYAGGGGYDTETWCLGGRCVEFPGIKQIAFYGIRNEAWWAKYLFRQHVIKPESLKVEGYNRALEELISYLKK